ncbi:MAG: methyltransferase type 12 [uncultured bacterium]|nr:MAG: methyltransferase type 12 [uncultured bacterium]
MNKEKTLGEIVEQEEKFWSDTFKKELEKNEFGSFSSYWWERYYNEIVAFVHGIVDVNSTEILEAGSGSGKASILLSQNSRRVLLDISKNALLYARHLSEKFNTNNIEFIEGNIFNLPFKPNSFDFVWNIGVIEHYNESDAVAALREMIRVTKNGGTVAVGVPNFSSGPIMKARILKNPFLKFVSGYRLESERNYEKNLLMDLFGKACKLEGKSFNEIRINYFGNPLPMETPKFIIKIFGNLLEKIFIKNKFLLFISFEIK